MSSSDTLRCRIETSPLLDRLCRSRGYRLLTFGEEAKEKRRAHDFEKIFGRGLSAEV